MLKRALKKATTATTLLLRGDYKRLAKAVRGNLKGSDPALTTELREIRQALLQIEAFLHIKMDKFDAQWNLNQETSLLIKNSVHEALDRYSQKPNSSNQYISLEAIRQVEKLINSQQDTLSHLRDLCKGFQAANSAIVAERLSSIDKTLTLQEALLKELTTAIRPN